MKKSQKRRLRRARKSRKKKIEPLFQGLDFSPVETIVQVRHFFELYYYIVRGYNCQLIKRDRLIIRPVVIPNYNLTINNTLDLLSYQYTHTNTVFIDDLHKTYVEYFIDNL